AFYYILAFAYVDGARVAGVRFYSRSVCANRRTRCTSRANRTNILYVVESCMNEIQQFLLDSWVEPYGVGMMPADVAIKFVRVCMKHAVRISGFDGFHRRLDKSPAAIQIDQSFSANYSDMSRDDAYTQALNYFSSHIGDGLLYEIVYEQVT